MNVRAIAFLTVALLCASHAGAAGDSASQTPASAVATIIISVSHSEEAGKRMTTSFGIDGNQTIETVQRMFTSPTGSDFEDEPGRVYILDLAPGPHAITGWEISQGVVISRPGSFPEPLRFDAKAGQVIYVGNLHMDMKIERGSIGNRIVTEALPEVRDHAAIDIHIAETKRSQLKGKVVTELLPLGPWGRPDVSRQVNPIPIVIPKR